jgi:hypothetical protein
LFVCARGRSRRPPGGARKLGKAHGGLGEFCDLDRFIILFGFQVSALVCGRSWRKPAHGGLWGCGPEHRGPESPVNSLVPGFLSGFSWFPGSLGPGFSCQGSLGSRGPESHVNSLVPCLFVRNLLVTGFPWSRVFLSRFCWFPGSREPVFWQLTPLPSLWFVSGFGSVRISRVGLVLVGLVWGPLFWS